MSDRQRSTLTRKWLVTCAKNLKSEHGENPEYDRALAELISDATGPSHTQVAKELGLPDYWG